MAASKVQRGVLAAAIVGVVLLLALAWWPAGHRTLVLSRAPIPAERLTDSLGVNIHLGYGNTSYRDFPLILTRLEELGIRHVRGTLAPQTSPREIREFESLCAHGIRATLVAGDPAEGTVAQVLRVARPLARCLDGLEGPNEWDLHGGSGWPASLRRYQTELYRQARADATFTHLPVVAPSLVYGDWPRLGDIHGIADVANGHPYAQGGSPEVGLRQQLHDFRVNVPTGPLWVTETGYQTDPLATNGQPGVAPQAEAGLILRTYLEYFIAGVQRTFVYELADERPDPRSRSTEWHFGLLNADLSPKPAFLAVRNLIAILRDPGSGPTAEKYVLRIGGDTAGVEALELGKHGQRVDVVLWRRVTVWDPVTRQQLDVGSQAVTVHLPREASAAELFEPVVSAQPQRRFAAVRSVTIGLGAAPVVLQIVS